ncbi:exosortase/archaeosortase family protein [Chloroflexota bacterium]
MVNFINFRNFKTLQTTNKLVLWFVASLAISLIFFGEFWANLGTMLSPNRILVQHHASPWGVLALCLIFLWLKRKEVWGKMNRGLSLAFIPLGLGIIAGAVLMPSSQDYLAFQVLLASLGVFVILFGRGAKIPAILLAIYGFAISFPPAIERFAEDAYSRTAIAPLVGLMTTLGYPLENQGQWVHFTTSTGEPISVAITAACAGPATMGVFLAIFALMMLDMPLLPKKAGYMFLFGVVGTWFQNFIRLIIIILVGYYLGADAMWTAHFWTIYILFPLWCLLFIYIYFRQVERPSEVRGKQEPKHTLAVES